MAAARGGFRPCGGLKLSKTERKALRKQVKARHTLKRHNEELCDVSDSPTEHLLVANGGLICGVERKQLTRLFQKFGDIQRIVMIPERSYAFVSYKDTEQAKEAMSYINGRKLCYPEEFTEPNKILYLQYLSSCPREDLYGPNNSIDFPPGLVMVKEFIDETMEQTLIDRLGWTGGNLESSQETVEKQLKHRHVNHFGYEFLYGCNNVDKNNPLPGGLPSVCDDVIQKMKTLGYSNHQPDQLTINEYQPGQGIPPHIDTHSAFEDQIISLSLGSEIVMEFRHPDGKHISVFVPRRSLLVMGGESRYLWTHGITPRKFDIVNTASTITTDIASSITTGIASTASSNTSGDTQSGVTVQARQTRLSLTFRTVRHSPCTCLYAKHCDSQQNWGSDPSDRVVPATDDAAAKLEQTHVHQVYDQIAEHFSGTRHSPWPKIADFLREQPIGSLVVDVGCGNGKYLGINDNLFKTGSDRSPNLVKICKERGHDVITCDVMSTPYRSNAFDVCLCIAVIHHLATDERRLSAIKELVRVVRPGGLVLVYVWAYEQESSKGKAKNTIKANMPQSAQPPDKLDAGNIESETCVLNTVTTASCSVGNETANDEDCSSNDKTEKPLLGRVSQDTKCTEMHASDSSSIVDCSGDFQKPEPNNAVNSTQDSIIKNDIKGLEVSPDKAANLPVNSSRNYFQQQDVFVPWHYKGKKPKDQSSADAEAGPVFHRYYHVFQDGELVELCQRIDNVTIERCYNDKGNWCILLKKTQS